MGSKVLRLSVVGVAVITLAGCLSGPGFFKQKGQASLTNKGSQEAATVTSDVDGVLTASLDGSSGATQVVQASASSNIAGSSIAFPPGSLAISTSVTVEEGAPLANSGLETELGVSADAGLAAASATVVISTGVLMDAAQPFTVAIAISDGSGLNLEGGKYYIVLYKVNKTTSADLIGGIIPTSQITIANGKAEFKTKYFGAYQLATVNQPIEEPKEVATTSPIVTKAVANASPLQLDDVRPYVAGAGATVVLSGKNFRPTMKLALANTAVGKLDVKSDSSASFVVPDGVPFGFRDLVASQDGTEQHLKLFALADKAGLPLITLDPAGVCANVSYVDANGDKQVGTKKCDAAAPPPGGDMKAADYDHNGNGRVDVADVASEADFAQGKEGTSISAASTLSVPADGSFFTVTGGTTISHLSPAPTGTRVALYFTGSPLFHNSTATPKLLLVHGADFKVAAGDLLEFVALPDGWKEINRVSQGHTKFLAEMNNTGQVIAGETATDIAWDNITADGQAEYDISTKTLTIREGGNFLVKYRAVLAIPGNTDGKPYLQMSIFRNNVAVDFTSCGAGGLATITCSSEKVYQGTGAAGDTFRFVLTYNHFAKNNSAPTSGTLKSATTYISFEKF